MEPKREVISDVDFAVHMGRLHDCLDTLQNKR